MGRRKAWLNTREPHGPYKEPAVQARRWEEVEHFKLANDAVRFLFYEPITWKQERKKGQRQTRGEQGIRTLPVTRWWAGRGRQDHQQGWEAGESEGQVGMQEKGATGAAWTSSMGPGH